MTEGNLDVLKEDGMETTEVMTAMESEIHDDPDKMSVSSEDSEMEPFAEYRAKIDELLANIGLAGFCIEPLHHGYTYQNCVYALTSSKDPTEQYILRVPVVPDYQESDGKCQAIENDASLLNYLQGKLPVPRIIIFSATKDNPLEAPFVVQTRLPGQSLVDVYEDLSLEEKFSLIDQIVELLAKLELIQFLTAGTFSPLSADCSIATPSPFINTFNEGDPEFVRQPSVIQDRQGFDLKAFLASHLNGWIASDLKEEANGEHSLTLSSYKKLLAMIDILSEEGAFADSPQPIVLHHWDFEPRNILVENSTGEWRVSGIIDWDDAIALPRPLARRPLDWIWDFNGQEFTGYLNNDHQPRLVTELPEEARQLKARFDTSAAERLEGYMEDAYGHGRWLRRIWTFARSSAKSCWYLDLIKLLIDDWEARPQPVVRKRWTVLNLFTWFGESLDLQWLIKKARECFWRLVWKMQV